MCEVNSLTNRVLAALGCLMLMFATSTISAQENSDERLQNSAELIIRVTGIEYQRGNLNIAIIRSPDAYERFMSPPKEGEQGPEPAQGLIVPVNASEVSEVVEGLAPGPCLVLLYHDLNSNGRMDKNFLGIPNEPYASSTGKRGRFGPPSWKKGVFDVLPGQQTLFISMD